MLCKWGLFANVIVVFENRFTRNVCMNWSAKNIRNCFCMKGSV